MSSPETVHRRIRSDHTHTPLCLWICLWKTSAASTAQRGRDLESVWLVYGLCIVKSRTIHPYHSRSEHILRIVMYSFSLCQSYRSNYVIKYVYRLTIKKTVHERSLANRRLGVVA